MKSIFVVIDKTTLNAAVAGEFSLTVGGAETMTLSWAAGAYASVDDIVNAIDASVSSHNFEVRKSTAVANVGFVGLFLVNPQSSTVATLTVDGVVEPDGVTVRQGSVNLPSEFQSFLWKEVKYNSAEFGTL